MTVAGWVMFIFSWTLIISLSAFCMSRVLMLQDAQAEHIKPIHEIDTGDYGIVKKTKDAEKEK
ncbi:MAG: hypothetical protein OEY50_11745 [Nitrospinota bacterium]|nr:hypothetical protein [Nitrospinota bacterium]MDH5679844.1 hypothetical protein [Nitrospinota bacterium]MDH5757115.1 hypothetical protein [Nitrospinota bacterium]